MRLRNGHDFRLAVDSATGREDDGSWTCVQQSIEKNERARHIVVKISPRRLHGFSHVGVGSKVDNGLNRILAKGLSKASPIGNVRHDERPPTRLNQLPNAVVMNPGLSHCRGTQDATHRGCGRWVEHQTRAGLVAAKSRN